MNTGLLFRGVIVGTRIQPPAPGTNYAPRTFLGVSMDSQDEYGQVLTHTIDIQIPQDAVQSIVALAAQLRQQICEVPVFIRPWSGKGGSNFTYFYDHHRHITPVAKDVAKNIKQPPTLKEASGT